MVLALGLAGCSSMGPLPSFHPAEYSSDQVSGLSDGVLGFACRECVTEHAESRVCAGIHPLEKPLYFDGYTPEGSPGVYVPVQFEYGNHGETSGLFPILEVRLATAGDTFEPNRYHSDVGYNDYVPAGGSRTISVGFVLAERRIREAAALTVTCPCPGSSAEHLTFEFVPLDQGVSATAAAPN